jgi:signal transduction histidine kinase
MMPHVDGYAILEQLAATRPPEEYLPVLVLTADATPQALQRALSGGARDFLTKPFDQTELLLRVHNLLETRFLHLGLQGQLSRLEALTEQAQRSMAARNESLSSISHDMGQPLAAVRFTVNTLQELVQATDLPHKRELAEDLQQIFAASEQMAGMISEISDMTRLQMGRPLLLQKHRFDLVKVMSEEVKASQRLSRKHRIRLRSGTDSLAGSWDEVRLRRVISNLLSNAVKFSPGGGEINVDLAASEDSLTVAFSDQGIGIPEADLPHICESFYRASNVVNRVAGTGIGLAGARQIIEQHGGSIKVESKEGSGTIVSFTLPLSE